ncbi:MAG: hypothetical protein ACE5EU_05530 [Paracoccaceae bacterium]
MKQDGLRPEGVLIYGTGEVGQAVTRLLHARGWRIAGAVNRAGPKVGQDLGTLAGLASPLGMAIGDADKADLRRFGADIAVLAVSDWLEVNVAIHRRLLGAGLNVICLGGESSYPAAVDAGIAAEIDRLAKSNGVTLTGCGLWDTYRLWSLRTLAGPCTSLRRLHHRSVTDVNRFGAEVARMVGVGDDPAEFKGGGSSIYRVLLHQVVASLGLTVEQVRQRQEPVTSQRPLDCPALGRAIAPGRITGSRSVIEAATREGVTALAEIDLRLTEPGEGEWIGWTIDGEPPLELRLSGIDTGHATASSAVNRIADVIAAPPGLVTTDALAPMKCQSIAAIYEEAMG